MGKALWHSPIVRGAVSGILTAAWIDLRVFLSWKSVKDATTFDYKTAALRWAQGAVTGAITGAGFSVTG